MIRIYTLFFSLFLVTSCANENQENNLEKQNERESLTLYTHRHYEIDQKIFDIFTVRAWAFAVGRDCGHHDCLLFNRGADAIGL